MWDKVSKRLEKRKLLNKPVNDIHGLEVINYMNYLGREESIEDENC